MIRVFVCGGGATNAISNVRSKISEASVGKDLPSKIEYIYLDTSNDLRTKNIKDQIHKIGNGDASINGSGGDKNKHSNIISSTVSSISENTNVHPNNLNIVVSTSSGGSGSKIAQELTLALKQRGHMTIMMLIADNDNERFRKNSLDTLAFCHQTISDVCIFYYDNGGNDTNTTHLEKEKIVNHMITLDLLGLTALWSDNEDLDRTDMTALFNPDRSKYNIPKGLLYLSLNSKWPLHEDAVMSRSLLTETFDSTMVLPSTLHDKVGKVNSNSEWVVDYIGSDGNVSITTIIGRTKELLTNLKVVNAKVTKFEEEEINMDDFLE